MKVLIYNRQDWDIIESLQQTLKAMGNIHLCRARDRKGFKKALSSCFAGETLVVFFVEEKRDMIFLESVEMEFMDIKLIIYFTDKKTDLFARAYKLYPRVVTGAFDSDAFLPAAVRGILLNLMGARATING
ncbi:MAG: hypothetical protein KKC20_20295 [Proteobacteria bacterium]|nr:hypothetical protein [Pseudomonadota bacterium]